MKYVINDTTLTAIGDAIREKGGTTELIPVSELATAITNLPSGGGDIEVEPIVLTGNLQYACAGAMASKYIELFGNTVSTKDINNAAYMFRNYDGASIPFELNFVSYGGDASYLFQDCINLKTLPKMNGYRPATIAYMFRGCKSLTSISDDYFDNWDWSALESQTSAYSGNCQQMFSSTSLRTIPVYIFKHMNKYVTPSYSYLYNGFSGCYVVDELANLPIPYIVTTWTSNAHYYTFQSCGRVKKVTFETNEDGSPIVVMWKSQAIDLTSVGWLATSYIDKYAEAAGVTYDKRVTNDEEYEALKNDADWWSSAYEYSRYNHDSAVETINSLPDTSAYLATAGGTNTIKFKGICGSNTDGGAINTLTEAEIAVAAAKGWTVSFT